MSRPDILEAQESARINGPLLFLAHSSAALCLAYSGLFLAAVIFLEPDPVNINFLPKEQQSIAIDRFLETYHTFSLYMKILSGTGLAIGGIVSWFICRKRPLSLLFAAGVAVFALLIFIFDQKFLIQYTSYLFPGNYIIKQAGAATGHIVNIIFLVLVAVVLFRPSIVRRPGK